jgi:AcrR family transcriptional regulator
VPPKVRFSKEEVVKAAVTIVEEGGLKSLTARNVAASLGASTAPVYSQFATMDELAMCVMEQAQKALLDYTTRPYTDRVFLNMGTGVVMFACEHRRLYRALLLEGDNYSHVISEFLDKLDSEMRKDTRFTSLSDAERRVLLRKMWTFTHGLASLICVGLRKDCTQESVIKTLVDVGSDVIGATLARHGQAPSDEQTTT